MDVSYQIILIGALLLFISILATSFFSRTGLPILLVFLVIGMLAGEQGPGRIIFQNMQTAHLIGVLALAIILLDAGLHTRITSVRAGLLPGLSLATLGISMTSLLLGLFAAWLLHLSWLEGLLLGAILSPTDAAAVFSVLHTLRLKLKPRIMATLEIESGSNDPIAVLLTISIIQLLQTHHSAPTFAVLKAFLVEIGLGSLIAVVAGYIVIIFNNWIKLAESLYPLLALASGLLIFAAANLVGGSGYLAVYLAAIILGNSKLHQHESILRLHDSLAWLSQISMFLMLGLLVTPSALLPNAGKSLLIAVILIVIARPVAVWLSLWPFGFSRQEKTFIAWTGLRGAVPIILAVNPLLVGIQHADLYFNVTFFVVVISILVQGWPLPLLAHWLKVKVD